MINKMCLLGGFAALGMAVVSAQGDTILFNTDTGQITGNGFAWGTSEYSYTVDSSAQTCTWNFLGDLAIESGTTLQFVGSNRASVQADEVRLGSFNGAAVVINASSYVDGSGNLIQGAGGGLGGSGGSKGTGGDGYGSGGDGGRGGAGGFVATAGGDGSFGDMGSYGQNGTNGNQGSLGAVGAGGLSDESQSVGTGGRRGYGGGSGPSSYKNPGVGGNIYCNGTDGDNGDWGLAGDSAFNGTDGEGGQNIPTVTDASAFSAGNGGSGGGGGGGGGQGSGGEGGTGGGGGGGGGVLGFTIGCSGGDGGTGGTGGAGGDGGKGGDGGTGGGAVELIARGRLINYCDVYAMAGGQDGSDGAGRQSGAYGDAGEEGEAGGTALLAMSGGDGGDGGNGGKGGNGGTGGGGGGGAAGTVRLAGTMIVCIGEVTGQMAGGDDAGGASSGGDGRLIIANDVIAGVNTTMNAGDLVTGSGSDVGLHIRSPQLNADAPRLIGLAEGYSTTGLLEYSASDLGIEGSTAAPTFVCQDATHLGHDYAGYDMVMMTPGTKTLRYAKLSADPNSDGNLYTGADGNRQRVINFEVGDVYGFLVPEGGIDMHLTYRIAYTILTCPVYLDAGLTLDPQADGLTYDLVDVRQKFDLANAPQATQEWLMADNAQLTVKITDLPLLGGCDYIDVLGTAELNGILILDFRSFTPTIGDVYSFMDAATFTGQFNELQVLGLDAGMIDYDMTGGRFTIVPEPATIGLLSLSMLGLVSRRR